MLYIYIERERESNATNMPQSNVTGSSSPCISNLIASGFYICHTNIPQSNVAGSSSPWISLC
jgi:hypothetical protein